MKQEPTKIESVLAIHSALPNMKYPEQKGFISIIVPIYNTKENFLKECLDSILTQTFANWEAILVNDGSTDNTGRIIDEYAKKDSRFIAIHKQNEGTLLARKAGLEYSKGEFIANLDHDDTYKPQFLEKMYAKITETNVDFVWCKSQIIDNKHADYTTDYAWNIEANENVAMMLSPTQGPTWFTWDKLIKREIYSKVQFPKMKIVLGEDPVQVLQIAYLSKSAIFIQEILYFHRLTGFSLAPNYLDAIKAVIWVNETLKNIFDKIIPCNVKKAFFHRFSYIAYFYFCLDRKLRQEVKSELQPLLPEFIKQEKSLKFRICLFLANKGIEFPLKLREGVRKMYVKVKSFAGSKS